MHNEQAVVPELTFKLLMEHLRCGCRLGDLGKGDLTLIRFQRFAFFKNLDVERSHRSPIGQVTKMLVLANALLQGDFNIRLESKIGWQDVSLGGPKANHKVSVCG